MLTRHRIGLMVVLLTGACSGTTTTAPSQPQTTGATEAPVATTVTSTPASTTTVTTSEPTSTSAAAPEPEPEPFLSGLDVAVISQSTPFSGGGRRPVLSWEPVAGAVAYTVLVMDGAGEPWWSWSGSDTGVIIGGVDTQFEIGGPAAGVGVSWVVFGFDDDSALVGVSPRRPLEE